MTTLEPVLVTRVFDAPREAVFRAWTDPDELAAWYGPAGMRAPRERIRVDLRVGGRWEVTMVSDDGGREHTLGYEIAELVAPELLVLRSDPVPGLETAPVVRVELHDHGDRTRMTLSDGPYPTGFATGAERGWAAALDALTEHLVARVDR